MSQKTRIDKLHDTAIRHTVDSLESRESFDIRVERIKRGYGRFGYDLTHEEAIVLAFEWAKKGWNYNGFAFDLADVGLEG